MPHIEDSPAPPDGPAPGSPSRYRAFVSYAHADRTWWRERWGAYVHRYIERFALPGPHADPADARLRPLFLDRAELSAHGDLDEAIQIALRESAYLIVVCSRAAARSLHVAHEVAYFKSLGRERQVLGLIVDGVPNAGGIGQDRSADECFPDPVRRKVAHDGTLTDEPAQLIAADARRSGDGARTAILKIIAALSGRRFDDLHRREQQRALRRRSAIIAVMAAVSLGFAGLAWFALLQRNEAQRREEVATARMLAARAPVEQLQLRQDAPAARMALEAYARDQRSGGQATGEVAQALRQVLAQPHFSADLAPAGTLRLGGYEISPAGAWIVAHDSEGVSLLAVGAQGLTRQARLPSAAPVLAVAVDDSGPAAVYTTQAGAALLTVDAAGRAGREALPAWPAGFLPLQFDAERRRVLAHDGKGCLALLALDAPPARPDCLFQLGEPAPIVARSADGTVVAVTALAAPALWLIDWQAKRPAARRVPMAVLEGMQSIALDRDGQRVAIGSHTGRLLLHTPATGATTAVLGETDFGSMNAVAFADDDLRIVTASQDGVAMVWQPATDQWRRTELRGHGGPLDRVAVVRQRSELLSIDTGGRVRRWRLDPGSAEPAVLQVDAFQRLPFTPRVYALATRPGTSEFVVSGDHGLFQLWDSHALAAGPRVVRLDDAPTHVMAAGFTLDGSTLVAASLYGHGAAWHVDDLQRRVGEFQLAKGTIPWRLEAHGGTGVALSDIQGGLTVWPRVAEAPWPTTSIHPANARALAYAPGSGALYTASDHGDVKRFGAATGNGQALPAPTVVRPARPDAGVQALATTADGRTLAIADLQGVSVQRTDLPGQPPRRPEGGAFEAWSVALSRDGGLLAAGGADGVIRLWQTDRLQDRPALLSGHGSYARSLAFSPLDDALLSGSYDGTVRIWAASTEQLVRKACTLLGARGAATPASGVQGGADDALWLSACAAPTARR